MDEPQASVSELARRAWGERARVLRIDALAGDASSRRYVRAALEGADAATAVLMIQSGSGLAMSSDELSTVGTPSEMPFLNVQRYLQARAIDVPRVYAADPARGLVLLEDVGDTTLWQAAREAEDPRAVYGAAVEGIIALQRAGRDHPDPACLAFSQRFDRTLFVWELEHFLEYGFGSAAPSDAERTRLRERFAELAGRLAAAPAVLAHRDYHSWNLFVQHGRVRVIDFQDALLAPATYDLASLLTDRMTPELVRPELEASLVEAFARRRSEVFGDPLDVVAVRELYLEVALQRALKVVGRFHYLEEVKGKRGYVAMLPHTLATVRRCLAALPRLDDVREILARRFAELR